MEFKSTIVLRNDTSARWASVNPVLKQGEVGIENDTRKLKVGNGFNSWKNLPYIAVDGGDNISRTPLLEYNTISHKHTKSKLFTAETNRVDSEDLFFRPRGSIKEFIECVKKYDPYIGLVRYNKKRRNMQYLGTEASNRQKRYHIVGETPTPLTQTYPTKTSFTEREISDSVVWTNRYNIEPVSIKSLIDLNYYKGEWIRFPYSTEEIARRFFYLTTRSGGRKIMQPLAKMNDSKIGSSTVSVAGSRIRASSFSQQTSNPSSYAISTSIGVCICYPPHLNDAFQQWAYGEVEDITLRAVPFRYQNRIAYVMDLLRTNKFRK